MDWLDQLTFSCLFLILAYFQWVKNTCYFRSEICKTFLCKCFNAVIVVVSHLIRSLIFCCASLTLLYLLYALCNFNMGFSPRLGGDWVSWLRFQSHCRNKSKLKCSALAKKLWFTIDFDTLEICRKTQRAPTPLSLRVWWTKIVIL